MLRPARGLLTVKPVRTQETYAGGRIILTENERKAWAQWQMEVVAVGFPSICEKPRKCLRAHDWWPNGDAWHYIDYRLTPSAWVIIRPRAIVDTGSEEKLYLVKHEDVLGVFGESGAEIGLGSPNIMSMEERQRISEAQRALEQRHRYGETEPTSQEPFGFDHEK